MRNRNRPGSPFSQWENAERERRVNSQRSNSGSLREPNRNNRRKYYERFYDEDSDIYESEFDREERERSGERRSRSGKVHGISHYEDPRNLNRERRPSRNSNRRSYEDFDNIFEDDDNYAGRNTPEYYNGDEDNYPYADESERRRSRNPVNRNQKDRHEDIEDEEYDYTYDPYYRDEDRDYEYASRYTNRRHHAPLDEEEDAKWDYGQRGRSRRSGLNRRIHSDLYNGLMGGYDY